MQNQFQAGLAKEQAVAPLNVTQEDLAKPNIRDVETKQAIDQWLAKIQRKARRDKSIFWGLFIFFQLFIIVPISLTNYFPVMQNHYFNWAMLALMFLPAICLSLLPFTFLRSKTDWNDVERMRAGGNAAIGTLLELLAAPKSPKLLKPLCTMLIELLPQMQASDAARLTAGQRRTLYMSLKAGSGMMIPGDVFQNYRLAVLKALGKIGDADALPIVEHFAKGRARTTDQKALQAAAIECLPLLRVRLGSLEASETLLRASVPESSSPDVLLRAIAFRPDTDASQLLRMPDPTDPQTPPTREDA